MFSLLAATGSSRTLSALTLMKTFSITNLLLLIVVFGLLIVLVLDRLPRAPLEFGHPVSSTTTSVKIYSYPSELRAEVVVAGADLGPRWKSDEYNPPLSARHAIAIAAEKRKKIVEDLPNVQWVIKEAAITPYDANEGIWFWLITFEQETNGITTGMTPYLKLVVLMDGTVIEPDLVQQNIIPDGSEGIIAN